MGKLSLTGLGESDDFMLLPPEDTPRSVAPGDAFFCGLFELLKPGLLKCGRSLVTGSDDLTFGGCFSLFSACFISSSNDIFLIGSGFFLTTGLSGA